MSSDLPLRRSRMPEQSTATAASVPANARTRIVGERTGVLAEIVIAVVRSARALRDAVRVRAQRIGAVVTPLGWAVLAAIPLSLGFGYGLGWRELVLIGWAAAALAVLAAAHLAGRIRLELELAVPHDRVVVGEPASGTITAANTRRRRSPTVAVEIPVGAEVVAVTVPALARATSHELSFDIPTQRRGVVAVGPVRSVLADPIGLVRRELAWTTVARLVVHPRTIGIPSMSTGLVRDLEGSATRELTSSDVSFHALREYQPGDDRRYIHWKSTARTGVHMVRQFEQTRRSHLVVAFSSARADYGNEDEFELAISAAGSLGARAIRDARSVTVVTGERTPEYARRTVLAVRELSTLTRTRLLDDLAVAQQHETSLRLPDVARVTAEQTLGASVAFLICGSAPSPRELRAAAAAFPLGVEAVAIVCDPERTPGLHRVAGMTVLSIGYLDDLRQALSRAVAA